MTQIQLEVQFVNFQWSYLDKSVCWKTFKKSHYQTSVESWNPDQQSNEQWRNKILKLQQQLQAACCFEVNPQSLCLFQEINGITAALAEELFHKGLFPFWPLTSVLSSSVSTTLLTINETPSVECCVSTLCRGFLSVVVTVLINSRDKE